MYLDELTMGAEISRMRMEADVVLFAGITADPDPARAARVLARREAVA